MTDHLMTDRVLGDNPRRRIEKVATSRWGRLVTPAADEIKVRPSGGLRILAIGSWTLGLLALEGMLSAEAELPGKVQVIGLTTDDPHDPAAKISVKRRFWRYYDQSHRDDYEWAILHRALSLGIPCYTGEVKCDGFRELLRQWHPDAIITAAFGQIIDESIINYPAYGIYNIHPADLLNHHGAGPQPWEDVIERKAPFTRVTLHQTNPLLDDGKIVGQSPEINLLTAEGKNVNDVRAIGEKSLVPVKAMVEQLVRVLVQNKEANAPGCVESIDFVNLFSDELREKLLMPLDPSRQDQILPLPKEETEFTV
ncbi:MAG: hypothetical protein C1943_04470 [Halochromatium sp.]|nr:hypothetical protein [Halochromatium sp.]